MSQKAKRKKDTAAAVAIAVSRHDLSDWARESSPRAGDAQGAEVISSRVVRPYTVYPRDHSSSLQSVAESLCKETPASGAAIALERDGHTICVASTGTAPPVGVVIDRASGISGVCLREGKTIVCDDAETDGRVNRASAGSIRSIIAAPILGGDRVLGLVEILSTSASAFTPSHAAFTEDVAKSLEQQYAPPAMLPVDATPSEAMLVQPPVFESLGRNNASLSFSNVKLSESARSAIALVVANSRTIVITSLVMALFVALLWLALRPGAVRPEAAPQQSQVETGTGAAPQDAVQQQPPMSAEGVVSAHNKSRITSALKSDAKPTSRPDQDAIVLKPAALDGGGIAQAQVEAPPTLALNNSKVPLPQLSVPQAAVALSAPRRSGGDLMYQVKPIYPAFARSQNLSGKVQLLATVGTNGRISKVEVISGDSALITAAVDAVRQWRYKPLLIDGRAVEQQLPVTVAFKARQD